MAIKIFDTPKEAEEAKNKLEEDMNKDPEDSSKESTREKLRRVYNFISGVIKYYVDIPEEKVNIITLWIIGTHFHNNFQTFPYLFINAMRGSGKTRLLRLISLLSNNGQLINSITEAVLFRTTGTLCLDEFEGLGRKENDSLKELLNSGYKQGTKVFRMKKQKNLDGEGQVVEEFQPYRPVAMANIWGMQEVLGDRCIQTTLEKSNNSLKIKLVENYDSVDILPIKDLLKQVSVVSCSVVTSRNIYTAWNDFLSNIYTPNYINTFTTYNYTKLHNNEEEDVIIPIELFRKINDSEIDGRNLELFFPLFLIAHSIEGEEILENTINYAKQIVKEKKSDEIAESKDVIVYGLVAGLEKEGEWYEISNLTNTLRLILGEGENEWLSSKWLGRALKRLNLIIEKKRTSRGMNVKLNIKKAKEKENMFKII